MDHTEAVNRMQDAARLRRPPSGLLLQVPNDHYFFLNSDVPVLRIKTDDQGTWSTIHPERKEGFMVFVNDRRRDRPTKIALTLVEATSALAKEA